MRTTDTAPARAYRIEKHKHGRFFNVLDPDGQLVCVAVYRKGAAEVIRRLEDKSDENGSGYTEEERS